MLSTSCKYAIRAAVFLMSRSEQGQKTGILSIARQIEANEHTTAKILQLLVKEGVIHSVKGPHGGFYMNEKKTVHLIDIVRIIDGDGFFYECGLGLKTCSEKKPCPIHYQFKAAREALHRQFCSLSVQQLSADLTLGKVFLKR